MFRIYDGRTEFYQWDLNQKLIVEDSDIVEVHFANCFCPNAHVVETYKEGELTLVNVPNILLQEDLDINIYAYDGKKTKHAERFEVNKRTKPADYVYTETEEKTYDAIAERVKVLEDTKVGKKGAAYAAEVFNYDKNNAVGTYSHAEGYGTYSGGSASHTEGGVTQALGDYAHAEGYLTKSDGITSHAEGERTAAMGYASHAEGNSDVLFNENEALDYSSIEEYWDVQLDDKKFTLASGVGSHAEGRGTLATAQATHAEGKYTKATNQFAHAEGLRTTASGDSAHAEGYSTTASGIQAHAEGSKTIASGNYSHAQGNETEASANYSCAMGYGTIAAGSWQTVVGRFNEPESNRKLMFIVGNGSGKSSRKNIFTVSNTGTGYFADGIILKSPNGTQYKITVSNDGDLITTKV